MLNHVDELPAATKARLVPARLALNPKKRQFKKVFLLLGMAALFVG
jgi:hypothetical protein